MSTNNLISAESAGEEPQHEQREEEATQPNPRPGRGHSQQGRIPSVNECLLALAQLPGLVATRVLSPTQANSIRSQFETILRHHPQSQQSHSPQITDEHLLKVLRAQPEALELLERLMTREQIDLIMRECGDHEDRQA